KRDMASPKMMNRLLQGDVGSGKTVVAIYSALIAVENGYQVAFMAPTEILAEQHFYNIREYTKGLKLRIALLTSSTSKNEREIIQRSLKHGAINIIIGTHSLIQERVEFKRLGLVIIDEQHRFGVVQRKMLREKGENPDLLVMTATPIPRTLALTVYGDLDISTIDELPAGRKPITTRVITEKDRIKAYSFIESQLRKGRQAYIVYPIIEESEKLDLPAVTEAYPEIQKFFKDFNVGMLHGRMSWNEKERVMNKFKSGEIQLLVCTPVIEVGIDVPNATVMLVEGAERFGLSQLHQLRGRVGRGPYKSYCLLVIPGDRLSGNSYLRLKILEETMDGFKIAEEDLNIRGPGEFFGTRQSGISELKVADIFRDRDLLELAREMATKLIEMDPYLRKEEHIYIKKTLEERKLLETVHYLDSG
ncbi:MAG: ATP-dependent DNA helicase RecG, partial [Thermosulfidibacteraceae bacterium]